MRVTLDACHRSRTLRSVNRTQFALPQKDYERHYESRIRNCSDSTWMDHRDVAAADVTDVAASQSVQDGARIKQIVLQSECLTTRSRNRDDRKGQFGWPIEDGRSQTDRLESITARIRFTDSSRHPGFDLRRNHVAARAQKPAEFHHSTSRCANRNVVNGAAVIGTHIDTQKYRQYGHGCQSMNFVGRPHFSRTFIVFCRGSSV